MTSTDRSLPPPRKIVSYSIADDETGGALFLYGNPDSTRIAIFSAGYPDDHKNGQVFCSRLATEHKMLIGLMCMPGYDDRPEKPWKTHKKGGYMFTEMVAAVREGVKALRSESTNNDAKLTGIFHDWGVFPGLIWANRSLEDELTDSPDDLVLFDVLGEPHKAHKNDLPFAEKKTLYENIVTYTYRIILAIAFALQLHISQVLASIWFVFGMISLKIFKLSPTRKIDEEVFESGEKPIELKRLIYMAYPYYNVFKAMFTHQESNILSECSLTKDLKKTPILYLYGAEKNIMFHDNTAVKVLERETSEKRSKSNAIAVENAGHWLYIQQPDVCLDAIKIFLENS
mmetsp:Transcript_14233/g.17292  ORF Transcript_14233/g.17292 Transcript_14233/m.17292 type:complete len:343 (-) Transcript_14233:2146-3174(-)